MPKGKCHNYTKEQLDYLKQNKQVVRSVLTKNFNIKFGTDISKVAINALCKRKGWLTGRTGCFSKGGQPWNTGTKGLINPSSTSFKKGSVPANLKPIGHERICSKDGIILIKVSEPNPYTNAKTRYRAKHHVVWENHNGAITSGMVVRFKDNDKTNCDIDNLELVSKAVHLRMNKINYANLPTEIKPTAKACVELEVATFAVIKKANETSSESNSLDN